MQRNKSTKKGFTLIELLVVVSIIALLAAILMPSLSQARQSAKQAACIANLHTVGLELLTYENANNTYFPTNYSYLDGSSGGNGYQHWTATINPQFYTASPAYYQTSSDTAVGFPTQSPEYVCPSHIPGGFAPTHFTATRIPNPPSGQTSQADGFVNDDDLQAPRLSYVCNEVIMPRKKYSAAHDAANPATSTGGLQLVTTDEIDHTNLTILTGEFTETLNDIQGVSVGGGQAFKSHRPTNAVRCNAGGVWNGETATASNISSPIQIQQMTLAEATTAFAAAAAANLAGTSGATMDTLDHITYLSPATHTTGSNYLFTDGHAAKYSMGDTLNPNAYLWGTHMWSFTGTPEIAPNTGF